MNELLRPLKDILAPWRSNVQEADLPFPAGLVGWENPLKVVSLVKEIRSSKNDLKTFRFEDFCLIKCPDTLMAPPRKKLGFWKENAQKN